MPFELRPLPYAYDALEPTIDEPTMRVHHDKHHGTYVTNLNAALEGSEWAERPIEQILDNLDLLPEDQRTAVRNNGGGHANHSLFWEIMSPEGGGEPDGELAAAIADTFNSLDELKKQPDKLAGYHPYHATRADLLRRLGRNQQARAAYDEAIELAGNTAETAYLTRRRDQLA